MEKIKGKFDGTRVARSISFQRRTLCCNMNRTSWYLLDHSNVFANAEAWPHSYEAIVLCAIFRTSRAELQQILIGG